MSGSSDDLNQTPMYSHALYYDDYDYDDHDDYDDHQKKSFDFVLGTLFICFGCFWWFLRSREVRIVSGMSKSTPGQSTEGWLVEGGLVPVRRWF